MNLKTYINESVTFTIPIYIDGVLTAPGDDYTWLFTAKVSESDPDASAAIQKQTGFGLVVSGGNALVTLVPEDTTALDAQNLTWDLRGQHVVSGARKTGNRGKLSLSRDIGREPSASVPIITTEPPVPFSTAAQSINAAGEKETFADADRIPGTDSENGYGLVWWSWSRIKTALTTLFNGLYDTQGSAAAAQAAAIQRANHTGTQAQSTVVNLEADLAARSQIADIKDDLTSAEVGKPLSANQGVVLKGMIDSLAAEVVSITLDNYYALTPAEQLDQTKIYAIYDEA